eukprot:TRINITY_DN4053_c0_g1_i7.p2 TRINITY_DN4053_c0_g1~~TRINITY_DN4053_c0_g1_i7.p2  ORF type:complete len:222 (-),score=6.81 TRINITY_DN4053_c0_g1_i7:234-899(-)
MKRLEQCLQIQYEKQYLYVNVSYLYVLLNQHLLTPSRSPFRPKEHVKDSIKIFAKEQDVIRDRRSRYAAEGRHTIIVVWPFVFQMLAPKVADPENVKKLTSVIFVVQRPEHICPDAAEERNSTITLVKSNIVERRTLEIVERGDAVNPPSIFCNRPPKYENLTSLRNLQQQYYTQQTIILTITKQIYCCQYQCLFRFMQQESLVLILLFVLLVFVTRFVVF